MKINQKEIENVSSLEPFKRYQHLLKRVADTELIHSIESLEGDWASSSVNEYTLYPVWPAKEYALNCLIDEWTDFRVIEININEFLESALKLLEEEGYLINGVPVGNKTGFVVEPGEFIRDITEELGKYC